MPSPFSSEWSKNPPPSSWSLSLSSQVISFTSKHPPALAFTIVWHILPCTEYTIFFLRTNKSSWMLRQLPQYLCLPTVPNTRQMLNKYLNKVIMYLPNCLSILKTALVQVAKWLGKNSEVASPHRHWIPNSHSGRNSRPSCVTP